MNILYDFFMYLKKKWRVKSVVFGNPTKFRRVRILLSVDFEF